ncbi:MAG: hypothetical protein LBS81_00335 [Endomicrobium sp.]|jgi:hypothetical protein|nr:hypothetical protein [Endomicrobium sp.]
MVLAAYKAGKMDVVRTDSGVFFTLTKLRVLKHLQVKILEIVAAKLYLLFGADTRTYD